MFVYTPWEWRPLGVAAHHCSWSLALIMLTCQHQDKSLLLHTQGNLFDGKITPLLLKRKRLANATLKHFKPAGASIPWGNEAEIFIIPVLGWEFGILWEDKCFCQFRGRKFWGEKKIECKNMFIICHFRGLIEQEGGNMRV